jgi:hypothetical protein
MTPRNPMAWPLIAVLALAGCAQTQVTAKKEDPAFKPEAMRRVLVVAVVRKAATQRLLEDAFVKNLPKRGAEGFASHTLVREGEKLEMEAWKKIVTDNRFDAVIVSKLIDFDVQEKDVDPKYVVGYSGTGNVYGYYSAAYQVVYQPGFTIRKETAGVETRVFDVGQDKLVWGARSKTNIEQGRDPEAQVRDFARLMLKEIYK